MLNDLASFGRYFVNQVPPVHSLSRVTALLFFLIFCSRVWAGELPAITEETVTHWADSVFEPAIERNQLTGAVISVVKDGALIMTKGYGLAQATHAGPVDPYNTRFRIGSITKTFTGTLLAKLVADGTIESIDDPANKYLKRYTLPSNNGTDISIRHLMTHSAGFEDTFYFLGSEEPQIIPIPAEVFDRFRPAFVRPTGHSVVYSNFGVASLGLLLEDQMGAPIHELMHRYIFAPLGMLDTELLVDIESPRGLGVPGTIGADGSIHETPFVPINPAAAQTGSIVSTAPDMAKFMLAHLDAGMVSQDLLPAEGFKLMRIRYAENSPALNGLGMTLFVDQWNKKQTLSHGGNWVGFHSWMTMIPSLDSGVFISLMSESPRPSVTSRFLSAFLPGLAPGSSPAILSASKFNNQFLRYFLGPKRELFSEKAGNFDQYAGSYQSNRRSFTSVEKLGELIYFGQGLLHLTVGERGLYLSGSGPWLSQGGGLFVSESTREALEIKRDTYTGVLTLTPDIGVYTFSQIPAYMHPKLHTKIVVVSVLMACILLLVCFTNRGLDSSSRALAVAVNVILIAIPISIFAGYSEGGSMMDDLYAGNLYRTQIVVTLCNILAALTGVLLARQFFRSHPTRGQNIVVYLTLANACLAVLILVMYNAIGWWMPGNVSV